MRCRIAVVCVAMAAVLAAAEAQAALICSFTQAGGSGDAVVSTSTTLGFGDANDVIEAGGSVPILFDETPRTTADVGTTYTATAADPHFAPVVERLTNGINGLVTLRFGTGGNIFAESFYFPSAGYNPPNGIDLEGWTIDSITQTIDALTINTPGDNWNGDGIWTDMTATMTVRIYGTAAAVPEPATAALVGLGALGSALIRRRRK